MTPSGTVNWRTPPPVLGHVTLPQHRSRVEVVNVRFVDLAKPAA